MSARNKNKRHVNLLPREDFDQTTLGRILKWSLTTFRYIVIFVELIVVGGFLSRFYFDVQIGNLEDDIRQQSAAIDARSGLEQQFREYQLKLSVLSSIGDDSNDIIPLLDFISSRMPSNMRVITLSKKDATMELTVGALSEASMNQFLVAMRSSNNFINLEVKQAQKDSDSVFVIYTIEGQINYQNLTS